MNGDLARRLKDLQHNQAIKRLQIFGATEVDELRAFSRLAYEVFGAIGLVEVNEAEPGIFGIGYYVGPAVPGEPDVRRERVIVFKGATHRELSDQVREWKAHR